MCPKQTGQNLMNNTFLIVFLITNTFLSLFSYLNNNIFLYPTTSDDPVCNQIVKFFLCFTVRHLYSNFGLYIDSFIVTIFTNHYQNLAPLNG